MATWLETLPEEFGRYRILKLLGQGGMGAVYLAHDTQLGRDVALKVPNFDPKRGQMLIDRFYQEARAAATVQHPNICPIFDVGEINGTRYLTMAYIDGKPLREWISGGKPLSQRQVANLIRKAALALHEAHQRGVVHRDLKPPNIMIDRRGEPMIMDFGLARRFREEDPRLTRIGSTMGTPAYMAPEQCSGDRAAMGPPCDIYSLGVILYELLAGRLPFVGDDAMAVLSKVLTEEPTPPSAHRGEIDPELERICLKAMAKKADARYETAGAMATALAIYIKSTSSSGTATSQPVVPILLDEPETAVKAPGRSVPHAGNTRTMTQPPELTDTDSDLELPRRPPPRKRRSQGVPGWVWGVSLGAVGLVVLGVVLGAVILYRSTNYGNRRIVLSEPNAAVTVKVDGEEVDLKAGADLRLRAGEHELDVAGRDFESLHLPFIVTRGESTPLPVPLKVKAASVRVVLSEPNAQVNILVNGQPGPRHNEPFTLTPRQAYQFLVTGMGYKPWVGNVTPQPGQALTLNVPLEKQGKIDGPPPPPIAKGKLTPLLCVTMDNLDKSVEIVQFDPETRTTTDLTRFHKVCASPTYSPDGMSIAFAANLKKDNRLDLYRMDADGKNIIHLTDGPGNCAYPSWSPKGDRLAIEHRLNNGADIWVIDANAKQGINLTPMQGLNYSPAWSPDGKLIAFASNRKGKDAWGLYVMSAANGLNPIEIQHIGRPNRPIFNPAWSPDSAQIAFSAPKGPTATELYVVDRTGAGKRQLTNLGGLNISPAWSPDGSTIAFEHSTEKGGGIWLINADGTNPREVIGNRLGGRPSWKPR
jgi:serine/threonine protein kinase